MRCADCRKGDSHLSDSGRPRARRIVRHGDVVISTVRTYLRAISSITNPDSNLIVSTGFAVIRPRQIDTAFASYAIRSPYFVTTLSLTR